MTQENNSYLYGVGIAIYPTNRTPIIYAIHFMYIVAINANIVFPSTMQRRIW